MPPRAVELRDNIIISEALAPFQVQENTGSAPPSDFVLLLCTRFAFVPTSPSWLDVGTRAYVAASLCRFDAAQGTSRTLRTTSQPRTLWRGLPKEGSQEQ